jgi:hypothetical protein
MQDKYLSLIHGIDIRNSLFVYLNILYIFYIHYISIKILFSVYYDYNIITSLGSLRFELRISSTQKMRRTNLTLTRCK